MNMGMAVSAQLAVKVCGMSPAMLNAATHPRIAAIPMNDTNPRDTPMGIPDKSSAMRQATPMPPISIGLIALLFRQELMRMGRLVAAQPPYETADGKPCRSEEHTSELQSLMRISYAVFCLKKKKTNHNY